MALQLKCFGMEGCHGVITSLSVFANPCFPVTAMPASLEQLLWLFFHHSQQRMIALSKLHVSGKPDCLFRAVQFCFLNIWRECYMIWTPTQIRILQWASSNLYLCTKVYILGYCTKSLTASLNGYTLVFINQFSIDSNFIIHS